MKISTKAMPLLLEFVGAASLGMLVLGTNGRTTFPFFGAVAAGLTYAVILAVARPYYIAQLNPIVTLGLWTARQLSTLRAIATIGVQMLGGIAAWQLSEYLLNQPLRNIAGDKFDWRVFVAEMVGALVFTFLLSIVLYKRTINDTTLVLTGFASVAMGMMLASLGSNGLINPAVAVAMQSWSWTYLLGPLAGGFIGMNLVPALKALDARPSRKTPATKTVTKKTVTKRTKTRKK